MTNAQLISQLQQLPPNAPIIVPTEDTEEMKVVDATLTNGEIHLGWVWR